MRPRSKSQIRLAPPIFQIVPRSKSRLRPIRNLVVLIPRRLQDRASRLIKRRRPINIRPPVHPPRGLQLVIAKRLHPKTNAIDPHRHPSRRLLLRNRLRVRLQRDCAQLAGKILADGTNDASQVLRIKQTRRSPANVNRIHGRIRDPRWQSNPRRLVKSAMPRNLAANATHVRRKPRRRHHARMEVAISALRLTKGNLYVNPQSHHHSQNSSTPVSVGAQHCCAPACPGAKISSLPLTQLFSPSTFTKIFRSRGPSNSQKKIPCHLPSTNFPSSTKITWLAPIITALACESVFPSRCR